MNIEPGRIIDDFFEKKKCQYAIPVYQRNYEWPEEQCTKFFEDIMLKALLDCAEREADKELLSDVLYNTDKLLTQEISSTKEKLQTLKTAADQANTALQNGEISQKQYDALQRSILLTLS